MTTGLPACLHVEPLDLREQLVAAGLPQRQALGILYEAVRFTPPFSAEHA